MTPDGKLPLQDWMTAPDTKAVLDALTAEGAEVRFVGGCVRDALAGRPINDIDLATGDRPERVITLLRRAALKAVPTGIEHGTVTAVSGHKPFEVTTLRRDVETHGRHATVAFTDDWEADAARRDFTFNALSCRPDGTLFDPFGGRADLEAGRVRFVGEARARIKEDGLRLLRFFRFHAHYGRGDPDPEGLAAAAAMVAMLTQLSRERVRNEVFTLLKALNPVPVIEVMKARHILDRVLPELDGTTVLQALIALAIEAPAPDSLLRLGALLDGGPAEAASVADRLRLSRAERERLVALREASALVSLDQDPRAGRLALYRLGAARVADLLRLDWARRQAGGLAVDPVRAEAALGAAAAWPIPELPIKGGDALALGVAPGEAVGHLLAGVEAWWEDRDFQPNREDCLAKLRELAAAQSA